MLVMVLSVQARKMGGNRIAHFLILLGGFLEQLFVAQSRVGFELPMSCRIGPMACSPRMMSWMISWAFMVPTFSG
jgi:hypothetical protein